MKDIARMALTPGMELGADVYNYKNELLFPAGTKITDVVIQKLERYSIMCVTVKEEIDFAVTHFEKVRLSKGFALFKEKYVDALSVYKGLMDSFLQHGVLMDLHALMQIYHSIYDTLEKPAQLIDYLYNMLPSEDDLTYVHCLNSALLAGLFASWFSMPPEEADLLIQCGFFYDIGKLKLPNELIWKPGKLTDLEFAKMKSHTIIGFQMLKDLPLDPHILKATLMHHERYDGTGYPSRLHDKQIDIYARYISIIDAYEAMTSARTYRESKTPFQVIEIFEQNAVQYDMELLKPILFRLANLMVGLNVRLSDEQIAEVIMINSIQFGKPLLRNENGEFIDLAVRKDLSIKAIY